LQNTPSQTASLPGVTLAAMEIDNPAAQFDLSLYLREREGRLIGFFEYAADLFDAATIERMAGHFQKILEGIVAYPEQPIATLPILTEAEQHRLLVEWNDTAAGFPENATIHQLFEAQVERTPDSVPLEFEPERVTYRELNQRANHLAHYLRQMGIGPEKFVGVLIERSVDMVVSLLAILKAGGAYVPLDPACPKARLQFMLSDSNAGLLLTQRRFAAEVVDYQGTIVFVDQLPAREYCGGKNPVSEATADSAMYVIYTSGSTGAPKGVLGLHRGALNRFSWMWKTYPFTSGEKTCQKTSLSFVDSVWEIFGALLQGVPTVIIPDPAAKEPRLLARELAERNVTRIVLVPSLLKEILEQCPDLGKQ
jgi:non-ribosomal peptide synthetase component F